MSADHTVPPGPELAGNLRAEWGKCWSVWVPSLWILGTVLVTLVTSLSLSNDFVHSVTVGEVPDGARRDVVDVLGPTFSFAQVPITAFAIHLVTPDYATGAIHPTFVAQPRRWVVVVAKAVVALSTAAALGALLGPCADAATQLVLGDFTGATSTWLATSAGAAGVLGQAAALGVGLAFITRSAVGALCLAFLLLVVTLVVPGPIADFMPGPAGANYFEYLAGHGPDQMAAPVMAGWALGLVSVGIWAVRRRDA